MNLESLMGRIKEIEDGINAVMVEYHTLMGKKTEVQDWIKNLTKPAEEPPVNPS